MVWLIFNDLSEDLPFGYRSGAYIDSTVVQSITKSLESKLEHANRFGFSSNDFKETLVLADRLGRYFDTSNQYISNRVREAQALQRKTAVMLDQFRISTYQYTDMIFKLGEELAILMRYTVSCKLNQKLECTSLTACSYGNAL